MNKEIKKQIASVLRVNLAGETGAIVIYDGQKSAAKLKNFSKEDLKLIEEMRESEVEHLSYFTKTLIEKGVRPSALTEVWKIGGFGVGFVTALLGKGCAMQCTAAVESVIEQHYKDQILKINETLASERLEDSDALFLRDLKQKIEKFCADEVCHKNTGIENGSNSLPAKIVNRAVTAITKMAICIAKRV